MTNTIPIPNLIEQSQIETMDFPTYLKLREKAFSLVAEKSKDEMRYFSPIPGQPYWTHLANVHNFAILKGVKDREILLAAILHDIEEDSDVTEGYLSAEFSTGIARMCTMVSKPKEGYMAEQFYTPIITDDHPGSKIIKVADRIDNMLTNYCYSPSATKSRKYLDETEEWFVPMARAIGWENDLQNAMDYYTQHISKM